MTTRTKGAAGKAGGKKRKTLNTVANKAVNQNAFTITNCLVTSVKGGDAKSAQLLLELAEKNEGAGKDDGVKEATKGLPLQKLTTRLAAEPQWPSDVPEEDWDEDIDAGMEVEDKETVTA
jgi:hypothetical protein